MYASGLTVRASSCFRAGVLILKKTGFHFLTGHLNSFICAINDFPSLVFVSSTINITNNWHFTIRSNNTITVNKWKSS